MSLRTFAVVTVALVAAVVAIPRAVPAADESDARRVVPLWPDSGNPGGWSVDGGEVREDGKDGIVRVRNVNTPTVAWFPPAEGTEDRKAAVIVCPGGGYNILAIDHEGWMVAEFLAGRGIHTFILKYRLPRREVDSVRWQPALEDAQRAVSLVRSKAGEFGIDPSRIGIMGFSAGGHLATLASTRFGTRAYEPVDEIDATSCRPDFAGLIYPAYLVEKESGGVLAGEIVVSKEVPPTFLAHAQNDPVTVESSLYWYLKLTELGVPAEMHLFGEGGHGYGMSKARDLPVGSWPHRFAEWVLWVTREQ